MPAENARILGWRRVREFLRAEGENAPFLGFFPSCKNLIRTLPRLTFDKVVPEDASIFPHEYTHAPDALRYGLASLPFLPGQVREEKEMIRDLRTEFFGKRREKPYFDFLKK